MGAGSSVSRAEDEAGFAGEQPDIANKIGPAGPDTSAVVTTIAADAAGDVRDAAAFNEENSIPADENENETDRAARVESFRIQQKELKSMRDALTEKSNQKRLVEIEKTLASGRANRIAEKPWLDVFDSFVSRRLEARLDELAVFRAQLRDIQLNAEKEIKTLEQIGFKKDRQIVDLVQRLEKCHACLISERREGDTSIKAVRSQSLSLLWGAKRFTSNEVNVIEYAGHLDPDTKRPKKIGQAAIASVSEHLDPQNYRESYRAPNHVKFIQTMTGNESLFQRAPIAAPGDKKLLFIGNGLERVSGTAKSMRNWNDEYQSLLPNVHHPDLNQRCQAVTDLQMLEDDFQKICSDISCALVNDHFLAPEQRSVKPVGLIRARMKNLGDQEIEISERMFDREKKTNIDGMTVDEAQALLSKVQLTPQEVLHGEEFVKEHPVTKIDDFLAADIQIEENLWEMIYVKDGVFFFMFGMLGDHRYGSELAALKVVSREIQASRYILQNEAFRQGIFLPMSCLTEWRGSRVLAIAELPARLIRKNKTGRLFECASLIAGQRLFVGFMKSIGFLSHRIIIDGKSAEMVGGCDTQLLQGEDFRFYCLNVGVCLPQFPRQPWSDDNSYKYEKIRPELLKRCIQNLNSDAFSLLAGRHLEEVNCAMKGIHNDLMKNLIPALAMLADSAANSGVLSMQTLPKMLHEKGINMRYLGLIWSQLKNKTARKILLSEMAARVIKQRLRNLWRASQSLGALSVHAHFVQTHRYLKEVFCDWKTVEWNEINKDLIKKYFYTFDLPVTVAAWQERVVQDRVCAYVCDRCGIQMAEGAIDSVLVQKSKFAFLLADIRAIIPIASMPQMIIPQLGAALQQVKQSIDASRESDRLGFAEEACSLVAEMPHFDLYQAESMCIQGEAYFNWSLTLSLMHARQALQHAENCFHHALTMQPQWWFPEFRLSQTICNQVDRSRMPSTKFRLIERCGFWFLKALSHCLHTEKTNEFAFLYHCLKKEFERMKDEILRTPEDNAELRAFSKLKDLAAADTNLHSVIPPNTLSVYAWVLCLTPRTAGALLHAGFLNSPLKTLNFTVEPNIPSADWQHIAFWGQLDRLTSLALPKSRSLTSNCLLMLLESIPRLKSLDLSGCNSIGNSWTMDCGSRASALRELKLDETDWWCYEAFNSMTSFRNLRLLSVSAAKDLSGPDPSRIARFLTNLRTINLSDCAGIDQVVVKEIACNCTELINLNLSNLENIGRVAFQSFYLLSNLQTLDLTNNRNIDHNDMENVGKLTKLKKLLLKNCTRVDDGCLIQLNGMLQLEHIDISNCLLISNQLHPFVSCHRKLHTIIFSGLSVVNEDLCFIIAEYFHMLHVDLSYCPKVTANGLTKILQNCFNLTTFACSGTETLTSTSVLRSTTTCLCTLAINGCAAVTNMSIMRLVSRNTSLQRLELDGIQTINDAAINLVAGTLKLLKVLAVSGTAVTEASVSSVASRCPELDQLRVVGCSGVTSKFPELMTKFMPWIEVMAGDPVRVRYGNGDDDFEEQSYASGSYSSQGSSSRPISAISDLESARVSQQGAKSARPLTSGSVRFIDEGRVTQAPSL